MFLAFSGAIRARLAFPFIVSRGYCGLQECMTLASSKITAPRVNNGNPCTCQAQQLESPLAVAHTPCCLTQFAKGGSRNAVLANSHFQVAWILPDRISDLVCYHSSKYMSSLKYNEKKFNLTVGTLLAVEFCLCCSSRVQIYYWPQVNNDVTPEPIL